MQGMKFLTTTLAIVILLMTGCTQNNETESIYLPLSFSTAVDAQTRVTDFTTDNLTSMGVFACFSQGNFNASTATPDFMYNQIVERTDAAAPWTYSPVKYWPNNVKDKISFFAYAPHNSKITTDALTMSDITDKGYPSLTFTNKTAQTDFLLADPLINKDNTQNSIKFNFKHALAKVSFYVKNGDATPGKTVQAFSVQAGLNGKYTFNGTGFTYSRVGTDAQTYSKTTTVDIPANTTEKTALMENLFIHPDKGATFSFTYSINGNAANKVAITAQQLPDNPALVPGAHISYTITVNKDGYTITATNEKEWTSGSESEIAYYAPNDLKIGDYYYSDGSYSDGGVRKIVDGEIDLSYSPVAPIPDTDAKKCLGIIFYVGKHPKDYSSYTDKGGNEMTDIRGYVMSLRYVNNNNRVAWGNNKNIPINDLLTDYDLSDFNGYKNTYIIKDFADNNAGYGGFSNWPAAYKCVNEHDNVALSPSNTSGWFLPSVGQVVTFRTSSVITNNLIKAQESITDVAVFTNKERYWHWSSNQILGPTNTDRAWIIKDDGTLFTDYKSDGGAAYARPVLTF